MNLTTTRAVSRGRTAGGMTLPEVMVAVALGSMLLAMGGSMWLFGSSSFVAMGNYTDLETQSRRALDLMTRDIRQASRVTGFESTPKTKSLALTNTSLATGITYTWTREERTLVCQKTGQPNQVYLTGCDRWNCELFQRSPLNNGSYAFYPATNASGAYDLSTCKLINMTWKCSRNILGRRENTEYVQTAQVVLRNKQ